MKSKYYSKSFVKKNVFLISFWQSEYSSRSKCHIYLLPTICWRGGYFKKEFFITIHFLFWGIGFSSIARPCGCKG